MFDSEERWTRRRRMMIGLVWPGCFFFDKPLRSAMSAKTMTTMWLADLRSAMLWHGIPRIHDVG
jgi:hypothetical protein